MDMQIIPARVLFLQAVYIIVNYMKIFIVYAFVSMCYKYVHHED